MAWRSGWDIIDPVKSEVTGRNENGSDHTLYIIEGFSATILDDLWNIYKGKKPYPMSVEINGSVITFESSKELRFFTFGMQVAFELCSL
jgi:hypothetical protein